MKRDYESEILSHLQSGPKDRKQLAALLGLSYSAIRVESSQARRALEKLKRKNLIKFGKRKFGALTFSLVKAEAPTISGSDEQKLMLAISEFLSSKKKEMEAELEVKLNERDYFEKLCKEYKVKIDELETQLANKQFKLW